MRWFRKHYIGGRENPYLIRRYIIPRNPWFNIYLHHILRSDDDRALHDHHWASVSIMLRGQLWEQFRARSPRDWARYGWLADGGRESHRYHPARYLRAGAIIFRGATFAHRLIVPHGSRGAWTLFITGPRIREWGFYCPDGWKPWREITKEENE